MNPIFFRFNFLMKVVLHLLAFILLSAITQTGGILYLLVLLFLRKQKWWMKVLAFVGLYIFTSWGVVPVIAPYFGREKVEVRVLNFGYVLANRNYVTPQMNEALRSIEDRFKADYPDLELVVLDANFPFFDGFPLLPHLSHDDGEKADLAFLYENQEGEATDEQISRSGYGIFEAPMEGELDQAAGCARRGAWQYELTRYFTFGIVNPDLVFSENANRKLLQIIVAHDQIGKVFVEPHLKERLGVRNDKIRFQGCHSVRHDDHFHIQLR